jgi:hypothetical protein
MRCAVAAAVLAVVAPRPGDACIRASEADKVIGWSADGKYALYEATADGLLDHAEILPTSYAGYVYTVTAMDDGIVVARSKIGACASFGDDGSIVERKPGKLTEKALMGLETVAAMKFGTVEAARKGDKPTAAFTGKERYDTHDVALMFGDTKVVMPLPVYCVGSCLADENWMKWSITVDGVHEVNGAVLYELSLQNVCNGGTLHRVITQTPASVKVPTSRCKGATE